MGRKTPEFGPYPLWTEARFWQFIRSLLRKGWTRWPPKHNKKKEQRRKSNNPKLRWEYQCESCLEWFRDKEVEVNHIEEVGSLKKFDDLPRFVERLYVSERYLELLCVPCHQKKTKKTKEKGYE